MSFNKLKIQKKCTAMLLGPNLSQKIMLEACLVNKWVLLLSKSIFFSNPTIFRADFDSKQVTQPIIISNERQQKFKKKKINFQTP